MTQAQVIHPAAHLRDSLAIEGWSVNEFAAKLGVSRISASRLLNEHTGITPNVALALERIGWSTADFWMRCQASYELAIARLAAADAAAPPEERQESIAKDWIRANPEMARRTLAEADALAAEDARADLQASPQDD